MSRSSFGFWGAELDDGEFAQALAALGVLYARSGVSPPPASLKELKKDLARAFKGVGAALRGRPKEDEAIPWELADEPAELMSYQKPPDAGLLAQAWTGVVPWGLSRLEIEPDSQGQSILPWIVEQLSRVSQAVYIRLERPPRDVRWSWPLRVGALNQADADQLDRELSQHRWGPKLCSVRAVGTGAGPLDLLVLPLPLRQALADLLRQAPQARAHCVLVLGGLDEPWERAYPLVQALLSQAGASGVYLASLPAGLWAPWFTQLVRLLSHDQPLDVALGAPEIRVAGPASLFFASPQLIDSARVSAVVKDLVRRLKRLPKGTQISVPAHVDLPVPRSVDQHMSAQALADWLEPALHQLGYAHETASASVVAEVVAQLPGPAPLAARPPRRLPPRWIQGQAYELRREGEPRRVERALRAGARHMLVVRIGPADKEWLTPPHEAVFPDHKLKWDVDQHELRVVFSEPNHAPQPQTAAILLPRTGASTTCQFLFTTRSGAPAFQGRVIVLHRNRVLQTALLEGQVVSDPAKDAVTQPLELKIEGLLRPVLEGLKARRDFALAIVANHTPQDSPAVTAVSADLVTFRPMGDLDDKRRKIVELLNKLADTPDDYPKDLYHQNNVELLWSLAFLGNALYRGIVPSQISPDLLKELPYVQLVSASHDYLPLEFFYDLPAPKIGAGLCPHAEKALSDGQCPDCAGPQETPGVGADVICPLGFWCMRLVIERQAVKHAGMQGSPGTGQGQRPDLQGAPFGLRCAPLPGADELKVLRSAILAASDRVDAKQGGATQGVLARLQDATAQRVVQVDTWDAWLKAVKDNAPSLLVLLPHTSKVHLLDMDWPQLEIGHGQALVEAYITRDHLVPPAAAAAPIVLLLGCETLAPDVGVGDFTVRFQDLGAAIVLSTLTPILGREAGPIAGALIDHMAEWTRADETGDNTFGHIMRALRRQRLAQGNLTALCLVAHGDADWRLAPACPLKGTSVR